MRKLLILTGFIVLMFGVWGWSINAMNLSLLGIFSHFPYYAFIAGTILLIIGVLTHPKELKEPFKEIAERFERMNKSLLIAAILIFFTALWLLSYGFIGIHYYHASEILLNMPPIDNVTTQENITALENFQRIIIHTYNNTVLILSYLEIFAGIICIATVTEVLQKNHLSFIIPSLVFAILISIVFKHYFMILINCWSSVAATMIGGISYHYSYLYLLFPAIASIIALLLIVWKYKEFTSMKGYP